MQRIGRFGQHLAETGSFRNFDPDAVAVRQRIAEPITQTLGQRDRFAKPHRVGERERVAESDAAADGEPIGDPLSIAHPFAEPGRRRHLRRRFQQE